MTTIFLDLDGVIANFDKAAESVLGTNNIYRFEFIYGADEFWRHLNTKDDFFASMELMPGAALLLNRVLPYGCTVLTALPHTNAERVDMQKRNWVRNHIGPVKVITCVTKDKPKHCQPGDVLIDDRAVNKRAWEAAGGRYIVHTDVASTLAQLDSMGLT